MELKKVCAQCGKPFTADRRNQRYCSEACRRLAYRRHPRREEDEGDGPVLRTFLCARCGRVVRVTSPDDHRKKFCSSHCERLFWKHSKPSARPEPKQTDNPPPRTVTLTDLYKF